MRAVPRLRCQRRQRRRRQMLAGLRSAFILFIYTAERVELHISVFLAFAAVESESESESESEFRVRKL